MLVIAATIDGFGNGVLRPVLTSRITQIVGRHEQGVALGISGSLSSARDDDRAADRRLAPEPRDDDGLGVVAGGAALLGLIAAIQSGAAKVPPVSKPVARRCTCHLTGSPGRAIVAP